MTFIMVTPSFSKSPVFKMFSVHTKTKSHPPAQRGRFQGPFAAQIKAFSLFHQKVDCEMFVFYLQENFLIEQTAFLYEQTGNNQMLSPKGLHSSKRELYPSQGIFNRQLGLSTSVTSISYSFVSFLCRLALLKGVYAENLVQNRFGSFISLFGLSTILKIRCVEHAH